MSELNYGDLAADWVIARDRLEDKRDLLQKAQDAYNSEHAAINTLEVRLHEAVKVGNDMPPARFFVVGYSYEKKGVLVSRYQGWTSVQLVKIEDGNS